MMCPKCGKLDLPEINDGVCDACREAERAKRIVENKPVAFGKERESEL